MMTSKSLSAFVVTFTLSVVTVTAHEATNPLTGHSEHEQPHHHTPPPQQQHESHLPHDGAHGHMMDRNAVHDQEHIKEHLDGKIENSVDGMSEEELQFHYFKSHDYDDNNMLDGLELITALTHYHGETDNNALRTPDKELAQLVDDLLKENDPNKDGFIEYSEFVNAQRAANAAADVTSTTPGNS